jgi:hypothetical protein
MSFRTGSKFGIAREPLWSRPSRSPSAGGSVSLLTMRHLSFISINRSPCVTKALCSLVGMPVSTDRSREAEEGGATGDGVIRDSLTAKEQRGMINLLDNPSPATTATVPLRSSRKRSASMTPSRQHPKGGRPPYPCHRIEPVIGVDFVPSHRDARSVSRKCLGSAVDRFSVLENQKSSRGEGLSMYLERLDRLSTRRRAGRQAEWLLPARREDEGNDRGFGSK